MPPTPAASPSSSPNFQTGFDTVNSILQKSGIKTDLNNPDAVLTAILGAVLTFVAVAAVIALIIAGLMYIFSFGDEDRAKKAKNFILYVILGLIVIGASILLVNFIIEIFTS